MKVMEKYLEATVLAIDFEDDGSKVVHIFGDSYDAYDGTDTSYRFTEYSFGYMPLSEILSNGMPNGDWYAGLKQYIEDCTLERLNEIYEHYDGGQMPKVISELTKDTPCGCYILLPRNNTEKENNV